MNKNQKKAPHTSPACTENTLQKQQTETGTIDEKPVEVGGPKGPEPTRYGDWEKAGRCSDF